MNLLQISSSIEGISSRVDGTWKIVFGTQELTNEQGQAVLKLNRKQGWLLFKETPIEESDLVNIPDITPEFKEDKSPSQRLRSRMFVYYKETKNTEEGFNEWYIKTLDKIGKTYLDKIEKEDVGT